jgi:hypothetical protein
LVIIICNSCDVKLIQSSFKIVNFSFFFFQILEKSLRLVFETKDVSLVKKYVCRQFGKLLQGRVNIQDLIFAREYRGIKGYKPGACVPALELTR